MKLKNQRKMRNNVSVVIVRFFRHSLGIRCWMCSFIFWNCNKSNWSPFENVGKKTEEKKNIAFDVKRKKVYPTKWQWNNIADANKKKQKKRIRWTKRTIKLWISVEISLICAGFVCERFLSFSRRSYTKSIFSTILHCIAFA